MIAARESSFAVDTLEWAISSVLPVVSCQLIGSGKLPTTPFPRALVWLFPCMCSHVGLEMGALAVSLAAARVRASVRDLTSSASDASVYASLRLPLLRRQPYVFCFKRVVAFAGHTEHGH